MGTRILFLELKNLLTTLISYNATCVYKETILRFLQQETPRDQAFSNYKFTNKQKEAVNWGFFCEFTWFLRSMELSIFNKFLIIDALFMCRTKPCSDQIQIWSGFSLFSWFLSTQWRRLLIPISIYTKLSNSMDAHKQWTKVTVSFF